MCLSTFRYKSADVHTFAKCRSKEMKKQPPEKFFKKAAGAHYDLVIFEFRASFL